MKPNKMKVENFAERIDLNFHRKKEMEIYLMSCYHFQFCTKNIYFLMFHIFLWTPYLNISWGFSVVGCCL